MQGYSGNTASPNGVLDQHWTSLRRSQWHMCRHLSDIVFVAHLSLQSLRDDCFLILHATHVSCSRICAAFSGRLKGYGHATICGSKASICRCVTCDSSIGNCTACRRNQLDCEICASGYVLGEDGGCVWCGHIIGRCSSRSQVSTECTQMIALKLSGVALFVH